MSTRIIPDDDKPSVAIEISLEKPLPDYDLCEMDQPSPRDVDGVLVSQDSKVDFSIGTKKAFRRLGRDERE